MILTQSTQRIVGYTEKDYNRLSQKIIQCCMEVHKELGPGLMESVYETCAEDEMKRAGLYVQRQIALPVTYKGERLNKEFIVDMMLNDSIILEFKSVEALLPVHEAQLVTYLKLADKKLGLLINFNVTLLKDGIKRKINGNLNSV
ncbi:MAG TPA: GxxExxY protein [Bacteroidia bacterium]|jgi:GxxExxY protein|nr:GxxExxY protein [Bacteroidia bacterium]